MKYEVQHYTLCDGWRNTWTICENGIEKPHVFDSEEEAQAELDEFRIISHNSYLIDNSS